MRKVVIVIGKIIGFAALAVLLALRIALAAVLAMVTPIVMPILGLLSGGGLLVAIGFACAGHWQDASKGLEAAVICSGGIAFLAVIARIVNPLAFSLQMAATGQEE